MDPSAGWCAREAWLKQYVEGQAHWFVISCMRPRGHIGDHMFRWNDRQWHKPQEEAS